MTDPGIRPRAGSRWWSAGLGLLILLAAAWAFALLPGRLAERDAYRDATPCPAAAPAPECVSTAPATVAGTEDDPRGKSVQYWLLFTEPGREEVQRVRMIGENTVYDAVRPGDEITLTRWHGKVRAVRFGTAEQETAAAPADRWRLPLGLGLTLYPFGLLACGLAGWYAHRRCRPGAGRPGARAVMVVSVAAVAQAAVGIPAAMAAADAGKALLAEVVALPVAVLLGLAAGWWLGRRLRAAADVSALVPVPPTEPRHLRATVAGEVPYAVDGYDFLVVGDGPVVATPDPQGGFAARRLPGTLRVRRVRAWTEDDPEDWTAVHGVDAVVLECEDETRPVRIVCARREAPLLLGALGAPAPAAPPAPAPAAGAGAGNEDREPGEAAAR